MLLLNISRNAIIHDLFDNYWCLSHVNYLDNSFINCDTFYACQFKHWFRATLLEYGTRS